MPVVELFRALGEPTRLEMVKRLSAGGSQTITSLSKGLNVSRQGARKHLRILEDSDIIVLKPDGRTVLVALNQHSLDVGKNFIANLEVEWEKRLDRLAKFLKNNK